MVTTEAHLFSSKLAPQLNLLNPFSKAKIRKTLVQQKQTSRSGLNNPITHANLSSSKPHPKWHDLLNTKITPNLQHH